jgi:hypothetical protein
MGLALLGGMLCWGAQAAGTTQKSGYYPSVAPTEAQITKAIDNTQLTEVRGSKPALAAARYDTGALPAGRSIKDLVLLLKRSDKKQEEFQRYLSELTNPSSRYFHHWLDAKQLGAMFGPSPADIAKVSQWLRSQGLTVEGTTPDGMMIRFSGTVASLNGAFHTTLHSYTTADGKTHFANASEEQFPAALAPVVYGVSLHNFFPTAQHRDVGVVARNKKSGHWTTVSKVGSQFTVPGGSVNPSTAYDMAPADFDTVYNVNPLWNQGNRGAGQTIVVLERSDVKPADVDAFRKAFLPADAKGTVSYIHPSFDDGTPCQDPGITGDEGEAALDVEWAGAAAPDADIVFASCADSGTTFGALQAGFLVSYNGGKGLPPPIWSLSYGECEQVGSADSYTAQVLWSGAAAEGVTIFVSSGDAGSVACNQGDYAASLGPTVNGLASSPYTVAVGGTDFDDFRKYDQYWTATNLPLEESAIGYIPEQTWNNSCASSQLYSLLGYSDGVTACNSNDGLDYLDTGGGGGGPSTLYTQPSWQSGLYGTTNHSSRLLPDVSLFSANGLYGHALVYCMSDANPDGAACDYSDPDNVYYNSAGGTSFAAPAMAGVQALINVATGGPSGNVLPALYSIGAKEYGTNGSPNVAMLASCNSSNGADIGSDCVFNDVTVGNIDEPCYTGSVGCYTGALSNQSYTNYGITVGSPDAGSLSMVPAWSTNAGYSMATGLGSINAANLADAMARFDRPFQRQQGYAAPGDFLSTVEDNDHWFTNDGFSDIAMVDPTKGTLTMLAMKGSVVRNESSQAITPGYEIGAIADFSPVLDTLGLHSDHLAWTGPDNQLYAWISDTLGDFYPFKVGNPYPAGWKLMGSAVIDNSGAAQLLWFNAKTNQFGWWKLDTDLSTLGPVISSISSLTTVAPGYVPTLADVNGDNYADIVWTNPSNDQVYIWMNDQKGGFAAHSVAVRRPAGFTLFGAGDVDGDGQTDLIWTNPATHQMAWWIMAGYVAKDQEVRSVTPGYSMASLADYDGDGLVDILWVGAAGDAYEWQGTGQGFESFRVADASGNPLVIPAGEKVQANRLQGSAAGGVESPLGESH